MSTAAAMNIPSLDETASAVVTLGRAIAGRGRTLLLLDNFEQLVSHGEDSLGHWLSAAPLARIVISSRERLSLSGECLLPLSPLRLPDENCTSLDELVQSEAGHLLIERVRSVRAQYLPKPDEISTLTAIVRRLDGLPLALELAAWRQVIPPGSNTGHGCFAPRSVGTSAANKRIHSNVVRLMIASGIDSPKSVR